MPANERPHGYPPPFALSGDDPITERLNDLLRFVESETEKGLWEERSLPSLIELASKAAEVADREIRVFQAAATEAAAEGKGSRIRCGIGCCHCCYRVPEASILELIAIWSHVKRHFSEQEKEALRVRVDRYVNTTESLRPGNLGEAHQPCPFLVDSKCCVYEARPMSCRGLNSIDAQACEKIRLGEMKPEERPALPNQARIAMSARIGLRLAVFFSYLELAVVDIGHAMSVLLDHPEGDSDYVAGKDQFRESRSSLECELLDPRTLAWSTGPAFVSEDGMRSPSGNITQEERDALKEGNDLSVQEGRFADSLTLLSGRTPLEMMMHVRVPRVSMTEEEIDRTRNEFVEAMERYVEAGFPPADCFDALSIHQTMNLTYQGRDDLEIMRRNGRFVGEVCARALPNLVRQIERKRKPGKLRVGYISGNLNSSNGGRWAAGWLKYHGKEIETYSLFVGTNSDSATRRFRDFSDHFYWINCSVSEGARFVRSLDLDVLIYTDLGLFARNVQYAGLRLARVQCTAWGHPDTSGLSTIDYYLSSELMEPPDGERFYSEKLVRLLRSGLLFFHEDHPIANRDRASFGLPQSGPILLMGQGLMKLVPKFDRLYAEICDRTGAEVIFLESPQKGDTILLKKRLEQAGVRARWLPFLSHSDYLALMRLADVSIDPPLWSGGNSTVQALMVGTPVVTLPGPFMRSRHSYAFLQLAGAPALIANDERDFVDLVCDFDRQREGAKHLDAEPIFEDVGVVRALDEFLQTVGMQA